MSASLVGSEMCIRDSSLPLGSPHMVQPESSAVASWLRRALHLGKAIRRMQQRHELRYRLAPKLLRQQVALGAGHVYRHLLRVEAPGHRPAHAL
eukprot:7944778-Alexandrium_andersonii.AAC.1